MKLFIYKKKKKKKFETVLPINTNKRKKPAQIFN